MKLFESCGRTLAYLPSPVSATAKSHHALSCVATRLPVERYPTTIAAITTTRLFTPC